MIKYRFSKIYVMKRQLKGYMEYRVAFRRNFIVTLIYIYTIGDLGA